MPVRGHPKAKAKPKAAPSMRGQPKAKACPAQPALRPMRMSAVAPVAESFKPAELPAPRKRPAAKSTPPCRLADLSPPVSPRSIQDLDEELASAQDLDEELAKSWGAIDAAEVIESASQSERIQLAQRQLRTLTEEFTQEATSIVSRINMLGGQATASQKQELTSQLRANRRFYTLVHALRVSLVSAKFLEQHRKWLSSTVLTLHGEQRGAKVRKQDVTHEDICELAATMGALRVNKGL